MPNIVSRAMDVAVPDGPLKKLLISWEDPLITGRGRGRVAHENWSSTYASFNPNSIARSRRTKWGEQRGWEQSSGWKWQDSTRQFISVEPEVLTVSLFFDTSEARSSVTRPLGARALDALKTATPFARSSASDVRHETNGIVVLARANRDLHRPPVCRLSWGAYDDIFTGVLTKLKQTFTMFMPDGTPVRATMECTFTEFETQSHAMAQEKKSADVVKTYVLTRGETLHSVAAAEYGDPALWRNIARANGIVSPRTVRPGTVLIIPKLDR